MRGAPGPGYRAVTMAERIELLGEKELQRRLAELEHEIEFSGRAGKDSAVLVARSAAGVGPNRSGDLAKSYRGLGSKKQGRIVSKLVYAPVIDFGWPARGRPAQRRVERSIEANSGAIQAIYERYVRDQIARKGGAP